MDRIRGDAPAFCLFYHCVEQAETVHFRLQLVFKQDIEAAEFRIHDDKRDRDTLLAQFFSFVSNGNSQVVATMFLQCLCQFIGTSSVSESLDHADHLSLWLQLRAVIVEVMDNGIQVHFQDRLMYFLLQQLGYTLEMELAGAFYQDQLVFEFLERRRLNEFIRCQVKFFFDIESTSVLFQVAADTDNAVDLLPAHQVRNFLIERLRQRSRLQDV